MVSGLGIEWEECDVDDPERLIAIEPQPSSKGYGDMEDFIARVSDPRARELLERAIAGRGAFRRFKEMLFEFEALREAWFAFRDARAQRRAIESPRARRLIEEEAADAAIEARPDPEPELLAGTFDARAIAADVAADLRELYGERLREVILFGSWARGDAERESDIDLLLVLDELESSWEERKRMDDVLARHSIDNDTVVSAIPVSQAQFAHPQRGDGKARSACAPGVQARLPTELSLGNLRPHSETPGVLRRERRSGAQLMVKLLRRRPNDLVTYTYYYEDGDDERRHITIKELAEEQLKDLESGAPGWAPKLKRQIQAALQ